MANPDPQEPAGNEPSNQNDRENGGADKDFTERTNKIVQQRVNEANAKHAKEIEKLKADYEQKLASEKSEWERQAKLSEEEKAKEAFDKERSDLEAKQRDVTMRERRLEAAEELSKNELPAKFVDFVIDEDADKMSDKIKALKEAWSESLEAGVKKAVSGETPEDKSGSNTTPKSNGGNANVYRGQGVSAF